MRRHPLRVLLYAAKKALLFWGPAEIASNKEIFCARKLSPTLRYIPGFFVVVSLAGLGLFLLLVDVKKILRQKQTTSAQKQKQWEMSLLIILFIAVYFLSYLPFFVNARFRVPIIPFLLLFAAFGVYRVGRYIAENDFRRAIYSVLIWIGLCLFAALPLVPNKPDWSRWYYHLGNAYIKTEQFDQAINQYNQALKINSQLSGAHAGLATAFYRLGQMDKAAHHSYQAVKIKPDFVKARFNLGTALVQLALPDQAIEQWKQVLEYEPDHYKAYDALATTFSQQGQIDQAIIYWTGALRIKPDWPEVHNNLATALSKQGKINVAIKHWSQALRLRPDWHEPLNNLAWARATSPANAIRNPAEAIRLAQRACAITNYHHPVLLDTLAASYASAGQFQQAIQTAQKALTLLHPDQSSLVQEIKSRLELYRSEKPYRSEQK